MNKLDIHEFLRIYLPGLFLTSVFVQLTEGVEIDSTGIATVSIFVGLVFAPPSMWLSQKIFRLILKNAKFTHSGNEAGYWETWIYLYQNVKRRNSIDRKLTKDDVTKIALTHYARRYGSPELYSFRLQKTFGVLYSSLSLAALLLSLIPFLHLLLTLPKTYHPLWLTTISDIALFLSLSAFFFHVARRYFTQSLNLELYYWAAPPEDN